MALSRLGASKGAKTRAEALTRAKRIANAESACDLMQDVAGRLRGRVQQTADGHKPYLEAVQAALGSDIDYAVLQKIYGSDANPESGKTRPCASAARSRM